jgi:hypothetical protein
MSNPTEVGFFFCLSIDPTERGGVWPLRAMNVWAVSVGCIYKMDNCGGRPSGSYAEKIPSGE